MRVNNLQAVRMVAALGVVLAHLGMYADRMFGAPELHAAIHGTWYCILVPLFFALSGFLLAHSIQKADPGTFLFARFLRLYPGFWIATVGVAAVMAINGPYPFTMLVANVGWTLRPGEYGTRLYLLGVEWSLVYEVVLYLWMAAIAGLFGAKRGLPIAAIVWLAWIAIKAAVWPDYAMNTSDRSTPSWDTVLLSAVNTPFFLGILLRHLGDRGERYRWFVLAGIAAWLALVPARFHELESIWLAYSVPAAAIIWFAAHAPQLSDRNILVRTGEISYGVYLLHSPIIMACFSLELFTGSGWFVAQTGIAAVCIGLLFGWFDNALHLRLRPLIRIVPVAIAAVCGRIVRAAGSLPARLLGRFAGSR